MHRWLAVIGIVPALLVLLSGAGLSFAKEIDRFVHPGLLSVAASAEIDLSSIHSAINELLSSQPELALVSVAYPDSAYDSVTLKISKGGVVSNESALLYLNPHSGKLLGSRPAANDLFERLRRIHVGLISPSVGQAFAVTASIVLLIMILLGFSMTRRGGRWHLAGWHTLTGLLVAPALVLIIASGLWSAFSGGGLKSVEAGTTAVETDLSRITELPKTLDGNLPLWCGSLPVAVFASTNDRYTVECSGSRFLSVSQGTVPEWTELSTGYNLSLWNLHSGEWAGLPGRGIWMWSVLGIVYLLYSGLRDWLKQTKTRGKPDVAG